jgi:hypothetical protein
VRAVVDFAVWGARPTGYVDQDTARWLVATLSCGEGPSAAASRIAFEIVKEAEQVDEALLASRCAARVIALAADGTPAHAAPELTTCAAACASEIAEAQSGTIGQALVVRSRRSPAGTDASRDAA